MCNYAGSWGIRWMLPKACIDDEAIVQVESLQTLAFGQYNLHLSQVYGNYLTLPPVDERKMHHPVEICYLA